MQAEQLFSGFDRVTNQVDDDIDAVITRLTECTYVGNGPAESNVLVESPPDSSLQPDADPRAMNSEDGAPEEGCSSQLPAPSEPALTSERALNVVIGHQRLRVNSVEILKRSKMIQRKSMIDIPLCRMVSLQVVRPVLQINIDKMKVDFIHGYRPGAAVFNVSTTNFVGQERMVFEEDRSDWSPNWQWREREFERLISKDKDLKVLSNRMFFVWDRNHRLQAWWEFINQNHTIGTML